MIRGKGMRTGLLGSAAGMAMLLPSMAMAQDDQTGDGIIEEVVVTARFRETTAQDLGASIKALGEDDLKRLGINDVSDLSRITASLNIQERGPNRNELNIRGITNLVITADLIPLARPVGLYVDDVPINTLGGAQIDVRSFDLQRVEVLRGPQGTLFGEGASAGAVRYFTKDPNLSEFEGTIEAEGVFIQPGGDAAGVRGAISTPIIKDKLALRVSGGRYAQDGFIDVVGGDENVNDFEAFFVRGVLLAEPTEDLTIRINATYDTSELGSLGLTTGDPGDFSADLPLDDELVEDEYFLISGTVDYDFGPISVTSITSYWDRQRDRFLFDQLASAGSSLASLALGFPSEVFTMDDISYDQFSQELRIVSDFDGPFQFTAGMFYRDFEFTLGPGDNISDSFLLTFNPLTGLPVAGASTSRVDTLAAAGLTTPDEAVVNNGRQISGFIELEYTLFDRLRVIAGARSHNEAIDVFSPAFPQIIFLTAVSLPEVEADVNLTTLLPKAAVEFSLTEDILLYSSYSTGTRNGNINPTISLGSLAAIGFPTADLESYSEDRVRTVEWGFKSQFFDNRLTVNANGFYTDFDDLQLPFIILGAAIIDNAGDASSIGFELEANAQVTDNLSLFFGANSADAQIDSEIALPASTTVFAAGTPLPNVPDFNVNLGGEYTRLMPGMDNVFWYLNGSWSYTGEFSAGFEAPEFAVTLGNFGVGNLGAGFRSEDWSLDLRINNIGNTTEVIAFNVFDDAFGGTGLPPGVSFNEQYVLQPRTFRLTARFDF